MTQTVGFSRALKMPHRGIFARRDAKRRAQAVRIPPCNPCIVCCKNKKQRPAGCCSWRRRWDANPRDIAVKLISSQSRYDHFDTAPYLSQHQHLRKRGELMGRTSKNIKLRIPEKPRKIKGFRTGSYRVATTISSQSRYDRFDTSAYLVFIAPPRIAFGKMRDFDAR